eukprot:SAG31_NODE_468_length_15250_cov_5.304138_9_plen_286_part_00
MVRKSLPDQIDEAQQAFTELICASQQFVRRVEGDASACSLRDVKRCLHLYQWFPSLFKDMKTAKAREEKGSGRTVESKMFYARMVLSLAHVYYYRIDDANLRWQYWQTLWYAVQNRLNRRMKTAAGIKHDTNDCDRTADFTNQLEGAQKWLCSKFVVEDGIAMNEALMENIFVVVVCILNRIPVFVVGKPGSSKTLTLSVLASNLLGEQSPRPFWRRFPSINIVQYQCSPMSTAHAIDYQFQLAVNFQVMRCACIQLVQQNVFVLSRCVLHLSGACGKLHRGVVA